MADDQLPGGAQGHRDPAGAPREDAEDNTAPATGLGALEADLQETRQQLAETVDELTSRLDVKARSRAALDTKKAQLAASAASLRGQAIERVGAANTWARTSLTDERGRPTRAAQTGAVLAAAGIAGAVALALWRRNRR